MFYMPGSTPHNLPHDPFKACVLPRPIGWLSTLSPAGHANLAPYSQFNNLTFDPPYVMFSANQTAAATQKDTVRNVEATRVFCWNLATYALREAVNATAAELPHGADEFAHAGLAREPSRTVFVMVKTAAAGGYEEEQRVPVPMVQASPVRFECEYYTTLRLPGRAPVGSADVVIGRVVGVHIKEEVLTDGKIDVRKTLPIARCGYFEYAVVREVFEMVVPGGEGARAAMEGSGKAIQEMGERVGDEEEGGEGDVVAGAEVV
ncbi:uncharacterized protein BDZ99DRAFT_408632 [Mytilinidion resinicola]|uniref:Flavin reductase like domain-containing protein n=1 Tax=Mytilinidion resinicola TaxID=574789 RepID=A0A6A6Z4C0_9PEZI|nr:uncharacterized protein BDZ99DRAFT_408632 [Mytilinidion resinicola]KAF2815015.1 hypothetical protein BDZ99DRAFT_408632 [Mytilinidion resinicola]